MSNFGSRSSGFYGGNVTICGGGAGTVTVVSATGCNGICVIGSPYCTSGTLLISNTKPYNGEAVIVLGSGTNSSQRCGVSNTASGYGSVSLGGSQNSAVADFSVIAGGNQNVADGCNTFIGNSVFGGNTASGYASFIGNGSLNSTSNVGYAQFIGNGNSNFACCYYSSVLNGSNNCVTNTYASVLGGCNNIVSGAYSGAFGCNINGTSACTFYTNNHCACGSFFTSSIASGCAVCVSGASGQLVGFSIPTTMNYGLFSQLANSTPITATTTERTLIDGGVGTLSVPANGFSVGDSFYVTMGGIMSAQNNNTITIRNKSGSVILANSGALTLPAITNQVWTMTITFTIRSIGGVGVASIVTTGQLHILKLASGTQEGFGWNTINNTTFDTTISNTLDITAQWSSNNANNSIYSDSFVLNKIY